jgi:drug/metabolite transporter (DMT)-like permease
VGLLAIPLWATWPALAVFAARLPPFELLALAYLVGAVLLWRLEPRNAAPRDTATRSWREFMPTLACAVGLCGSSALFIFATHRIPAAQAHLIAYLWPAMIVIIGGVLRVIRVNWRHLVGVALGFAGAAVLISGAPLEMSASGVVIALLSGLSWALYCLFRLRQGAAAGNVLTSACAVSAGVCALLHLATERTVLPDLGALLAAVSIGIFPLALANFAWDRGLRQGNSQLLAVMAYATPVLSALLLIAAGKAMATASLAIGAFMIAAAGLVSRDT